MHTCMGVDEYLFGKPAGMWASMSAPFRKPSANLPRPVSSTNGYTQQPRCKKASKQATKSLTPGVGRTSCSWCDPGSMRSLRCSHKQASNQARKCDSYLSQPIQETKKKNRNNIPTHSTSATISRFLHAFRGTSATNRDCGDNSK
jgi:hypothetical protein